MRDLDFYLPSEQKGNFYDLVKTLTAEYYNAYKEGRLPTELMPSDTIFYSMNEDEIDYIVNLMTDVEKKVNTQSY